MAWVAIVLAGGCEVLGVLAINNVNRKKNLLAYLFLVVNFAASFSLLSYALQTVSMGTGYAIWTGIGTAGSAVLGMLIFKESKDWKRFLFIAMILVSAVGLKLIAT
ncbi:multidrug efflux SMR transporter [Paenibacillus albiflavus]|uniref:Multidrug efflux SMR transporter n=1 Tax=Paenibacillus albiflavus TaxID=2545760 RepID=A0A4R4EFM1_9BACL|nr:multidrug efflux SMR transporter [Paenibacillus albiflavus]TCZ78854.1 multidrug efflux SMR transporter [Paenibacillus albiflavus]